MYIHILLKKHLYPCEIIMAHRRKWYGLIKKDARVPGDKGLLCDSLSENTHQARMPSQMGWNKGSFSEVPSGGEAAGGEKGFSVR